MRLLRVQRNALIIVAAVAQVCPINISPPCRFQLKFFLKCNQNCLKNAGNPRDMRRFQVCCLQSYCLIVEKSYSYR